MKRRNLFQILLVISIISIHFSCNTNTNMEELEKEILDLHKEMIDAHINKKVDFFTKNIADNYMQVQRGEINHPSKNEIIKGFDEYLNSTTFTKYENLQEPMVKVSKDGSLAWCIVQMKIEGEQKSENNSIRKLNFVVAWITLYEKMDNKWIRLGEVDNFKSED